VLEILVRNSNSLNGAVVPSHLQTSEIPLKRCINWSCAISASTSGIPWQLTRETLTWVLQVYYRRSYNGSATCGA
jgi:hypothetical protein